MKLCAINTRENPRDPRDNSTSAIGSVRPKMEKRTADQNAEKGGSCTNQQRNIEIRH